MILNKNNSFYFLFFCLLFLTNQILPQNCESNFKYCSGVRGFPGNNFFSYFPSGDSTLSVDFYDLKIEVLINPDFIRGNADIYFRKKSGLESFFFLNLSNALLVDSVKINGVSVNFVHQNDKLTVFAWSNFIQDSVYIASVKYKGLPVPTGFGSFVFANHSSNPVVWSLSQPYGSQDWFPCKNSIYEKADSSYVRVTCDDNLIAVSNGVLMSTFINTDGTKTFYWKNSYPISVYLISIAVSNYYEYRNYFKYSSNDSLEIVHFVYPEMFGSLKEQLDKTPVMMKIFSEKFGEYPFIKEKYGHAQANISGGMEHQTVTTIGIFTDGVIAHELAHQWFGDKITCRDWHHIWLNEGFATYSEGIYIENMFGVQSYKDFIRLKMFDAKKAKGTLFVQNIDLISEIFSGFRSYSKGAVVLHMLRGVVGDSVFFRIMRSYANDSALSYGVAVTEDFKEICEKESGINLDYFFNQWIYGENFPVYTIRWSYEKKYDNLYDIFVKVIQNVNTGPLFFKMPVEIQLKTELTDTVFKVFNDSLVQNYQFVVEGRPVSLKFDPDDKILKDKSGDDIYEEISYILYQNYPNPFNPKTTIEYKIYQYDNVKLIVYDVMGREIKTLVNEKQRPGFYRVEFIPENLASGIYFYRISSGDFSDTKKLVYVK